MSQPQFSNVIEIAASPERIWRVMADMERWPVWTPSVVRVKRLTPGLFGVGSRARFHQPTLPPAWWCVTEFVSGRQFTWVSLAPGVRVTARHLVETTAIGSRVTLSIQYEGLFGTLLARLTHVLNERYLATAGANAGLNPPDLPHPPSPTGAVSPALENFAD